MSFGFIYLRPVRLPTRTLMGVALALEIPAPVGVAAAYQNKI